MNRKPLFLRPVFFAALIIIAIGSAVVAQDALATATTGNDIPPATVFVTDAGVQPHAITVTVGAQVTWINSTGNSLQLWSQRNLFLPFVRNSNGSQTSGSAQTDTGQVAQDYWESGPLLPGQQYTRNFAQPGRFYYFASSAMEAVGVITVLADALAATVWIDAETGGTVQIGKSTLTIPPGSLSQDTGISVLEPINGTTMQDDGMMAISLQPSGLQFSQPATLLIAYGDTGEYDEDLMNVVSYDESTGEWESYETVAQDKAQNTVVVAVEHFSWWLTHIDDPLYVVMEMPSKYLEPGDILVRMHGKYPNCDSTGTWFPGHTAIYSDTVRSAGSDVGWIIEANTYDVEDFLACGPQPGNVREYPFGRFMNETCGFYMGARKQPLATSVQKSMARDYALTQRGKGYLAVGQGNYQAECFSCVGLVEAAYDAAGASIIPKQEEFPYITPLQQFRNTKPVDSISVNVSETVRIPVKAIVKEAVSFGGDYYTVSDTVTAPGLPPGAAFSHGLFEWTPKIADGGITFTVMFQSQMTVAGKLRTVVQPLIIHVKAKPAVDNAEEVLIPAGTFKMGCDSSNDRCVPFPRDTTFQTTYLDSYYIDKYEVTNARYKACVDSGTCTVPERTSSSTRSSYYGNPIFNDYPVLWVNWYQAKRFCEWAGKRLPTDAEWEKAARGDSDTRVYPWGNRAPDCSTVNYGYQGDTGLESCVGDTTRVGSYAKGVSPYGVFDMAGNVCEWTSDLYYPSDSPSDVDRSVRGGSWDGDICHPDGSVRLAQRSSWHPDYGLMYRGFRCVRTP